MVLVITDFLLLLLHPLLGTASSALPDYSLPTLSESGALAWFAPINYMLPVAEVFTAVFAVLALGPAFCTVTLGLWLIGLVRGGGNRA